MSMNMIEKYMALYIWLLEKCMALFIWLLMSPNGVDVKKMKGHQD